MEENDTERDGIQYIQYSRLGSKIYMTSEMGKLSCVSILHPWNHLNTYSVNTFVLHENI